MPPAASDHVERSRRAEIVAEATRIFAEKGYDAASFREIAEAVGAAKGNVTYYFSVKDDLLYEIVLDLHQRFVALTHTWAGSAGTPADALASAARDHVLLVCESTDATRVAYESSRALSATRRREILDLRDRYEAAFRRLVAAAAPAGTSPAKVAITTRLALGSMNWIYQWYRADGGVRPGALADHTARSVCAQAAALEG